MPTSTLPSLFASKPLSPDNAEKLAVPLQALADPSRLQILTVLLQGESNVRQLVSNLNYISQPTVSHHLKVLLIAGFVLCRKEGVFRHYRLVHSRFTAVAAALQLSEGHE